MGSEGGYLFGRNPDSTAQTAPNPWENRDATLAVLETNGIGSASASAVHPRQPHRTRRIRDQLGDGSLAREWSGSCGLLPPCG